MLHEIILALHGYVSSILNKNSQAVEMIKVLHPSEKALLKRILQIGETYAQIQVFIDKYICPQIELDLCIEGGGNDESGLICGMYLQAFCDGVQKVLQPYRNDVVALEKMAMQDPFLSLACINSSVGGYSTLLCMINSMIHEIKDENIHGCKLLQYVCKYLCTGVETMRDALLKIAGCCHVVLVNQLTNWLLYGRTMDQYGEFFIRENKSSVPVANVDETDDGQAAGSSDKIITNTGDFVLDYDYLPPYISYSMGNKILYIGRTVVLFKTGITGKSEVGSKNDVFLQEEIELVQSIRNCSFQETQQLENVVINLEESVTKRLWVMAMEKADLMGQLTAMKDFYLLSRGELFVDFLNKIGGFLNKQVSSTVARDLNLALVTSARNVQYYDDLTLEKFQFKLPSKDSISIEAKVKSVLRLEYSPTSPLHLFFSPVVIDNYNVLFRFFLKVKQAQLNLHTIWMKDVKNKKQLLTDRSWQLRNDLMLLVENMQCYLQWDVVESEHTAFLIELKKTQDFEKIRHLHHKFLFNILSQAFLIPNDARYDENTGLLLVQPTTGTSAAVRNVKPHTANVFLCHILDLSEAFCQLVTKSEPADIHDELETMSEKLSHCVKVLLRLITNLRNQVSGVHLSKLLLRLDYNHFFSQNRAANVFSKT